MAGCQQLLHLGGVHISTHFPVVLPFSIAFLLAFTLSFQLFSRSEICQSTLGGTKSNSKQKAAKAPCPKAQVFKDACWREKARKNKDVATISDRSESHFWQGGDNRQFLCNNQTVHYAYHFTDFFFKDFRKKARLCEQSCRLCVTLEELQGSSRTLLLTVTAFLHSYASVLLPSLSRPVSSLFGCYENTPNSYIRLIYERCCKMVFLHEIKLFCTKLFSINHT